MVPASIADTIGYVSDACRAHASGRNVSLEVTSEEPLIRDADPGQLQQALFNLVLMRSTRRFPAQPSTAVRPQAISKSPSILKTPGSDSGGRTDADLRTLLHDQAKGTDLDLSIARNIARAHGEDLVLATKDADRVRFSFSLPYSNGRTGVRN